MAWERGLCNRESWLSTSAHLVIFVGFYVVYLFVSEDQCNGSAGKGAAAKPDDLSRNGWTHVTGENHPASCLLSSIRAHTETTDPP